MCRYNFIGKNKTKLKMKNKTKKIIYNEKSNLNNNEHEYLYPADGAYANVLLVLQVVTGVLLLRSRVQHIRMVQKNNKKNEFT